MGYSDYLPPDVKENRGIQKLPYTYYPYYYNVSDYEHFEQCHASLDNFTEGQPFRHTYFHLEVQDISIYSSNCNIRFQVFARQHIQIYKNKFILLALGIVTLIVGLVYEYNLKNVAYMYNPEIYISRNLRNMSQFQLVMQNADIVIQIIVIFLSQSIILLVTEINNFSYEQNLITFYLVVAAVVTVDANNIR